MTIMILKNFRSPFNFMQAGFKIFTTKKKKKLGVPKPVDRRIEFYGKVTRRLPSFEKFTANDFGTGEKCN